MQGAERSTRGPEPGGYSAGSAGDAGRMDGRAAVRAHQKESG